jgi:hypothetical protein
MFMLLEKRIVNDTQDCTKEFGECVVEILVLVWRYASLDRAAKYTSHK